MVADLQPFLELVRKLDGKDFAIPTDRLIRVREAIKILGIGQATIEQFVKAGLLTPLCVNSDQRRFWLSEVMTLARIKHLEMSAGQEQCKLGRVVGLMLGTLA